MAGKIVINLGQIKQTDFRLYLNRKFKPAGRERVAKSIQAFTENFPTPTTLTIENRGLCNRAADMVQRYQVLGSASWAKRLEAAGVVEISIDKPVPAVMIDFLFDIISTKPISEASKILDGYGYTFVYLPKADI